MKDNACSLGFGALPSSLIEIPPSKHLRNMESLLSLYRML